VYVDRIPQFFSPGAYGIVCDVNWKIYVGSSFDVNGRTTGHQRDLRANRHVNKHLQNAWNKYGEEHFQFIVLETCERTLKATYRTEQKWIDEFESYKRDKGYNIVPYAAGGSAKGLVISTTARAQMSESHTGLKQSEETVNKRANKIRGRKWSNEERDNHIANHWAYGENAEEVKAKLRGKKRTQEQKDKLAGNHWSRTDKAEEIGRKISKSLRGKPHTEEQNAVTSATTKAAMQDPAIRAKISAKVKGRKMPESAKAKISAAVRERMASKEVRNQISAKLKGRKLLPEHKAKIRAAKLAYESRKRLARFEALQAEAAELEAALNEPTPTISLFD